MISPTGSSPHPKKPASGFTYIELLIVLVILSIMLAFSIPLFSRTFSHLEVEVFSYKVAKLLGFAGQRAVASGGAMRVHFDTKGRQYRLLQAQDGSAEGPFEPVPGRVGITQTVPDTIVLNPSHADATFYPNGSADAFELLIVDKKRKGYKLVTNVWTGHVRLIRTDEN